MYGLVGFSRATKLRMYSKHLVKNGYEMNISIISIAIENKEIESKIRVF